METEILGLKSQICKLIASPEKDPEQALNILKRLDNMDVTLQILKSTEIAPTVNEFSKHIKGKITKTFCKSLIKKWQQLGNTASSSNEEKYKKKLEKMNKKLVEKGEEIDPKNKKNNGKKKAEKISKKQPEKSVQAVGENGQTNKKGKKKVEKINKKLPEKPDQVEVIDSEDEMNEAVYVKENDPNVRAKAMNMIFKALGVDENLKDRNIEQLAKDLEQSIFDIFKNTGHEYRYRIMSRSFNLKDPKNPDLRNRFGIGSITPASMAVLTAQEMASDELKDLRAAYLKKGIHQSRMVTAQGTNTSLLQCGKCKKKNCTYNQMQTRSADEPMTTFVLCNDCGNRWKF